MLQSCGGRAIRALRLTLSQRHAFQPCRPVFGFTRASCPRHFHVSNLTLSEEILPLRKLIKDDKRSKKLGAVSHGNAPSSVLDARLVEWELTVGIEIHAQISTSRKLFSTASTAFSESANSHVSQFDLSVPGTLPVFQKANLIPALRAAIALNCDILPTSYFDRKHYFYHDQPAGYQITQYYKPFAKDGVIVLSQYDGISVEPLSIGIKQIQMEQDTAKTQEQDESTNLVDYNRAGQPLIEIISLPHIHSPEVASAYVRKVQAILLSVNAVTTGMEMGGLRADVNVSVRRRSGEPGKHAYSGVGGLGQRTEIKNLSTLKGVEDAIKAERDRQIAILEAGGTIKGETRGWSLNRPGETRRLRGKEGEVDYRYMPDPDIPPLRISREVIEHIRTTLPKTPDKLLDLLVNQDSYGLTPTDAKILLGLDSGERLEFFQEVVDELETLSGLVSEHPSASDAPTRGRTAANWVLQELGSLMTNAEQSWTENQVTASGLAAIIHELSTGTITGSSAKQILKLVFQGDKRDVERIIRDEELEFKPLSNEEYTIRAAEVIDANPAVVKDIREKGRTGKVMFLVGQMMRKGEDGRIEAKKAEESLRRLILENGSG